MAKRKAVPPVARPAGKQRLVEVGKDILILLLTCSALFLAWQTPLVNQFRGLVSPPAEGARPAAGLPKEAVEPYGVTARNSKGLYGTVYHGTQTARTFEQISPLLEEGFATAGASERITRRQWQGHLEEPGVYCVFQGAPPLNILGAWLGEGEGTFEGNAQALLLSWDGGRVWLSWRDGESYYRCPTQVAYEGHMDSILESFDPNGAAFAYSLAQTDRAYASVDPDTLIPMTFSQPREYTASTPDLVGNRETLEQLLSTLGFSSGVGSAYEVSGGLAINEGGDRLRVSSDGTVVFHAGDEVRYPVASLGERPTAEEAAMAAWLLLDQAVTAWKGETDYVLTGVEETPEGWQVTFHCCLEGIPLRVGTEGWCASFTVAGQALRDFTLTLRSYTPTGEAVLLPGPRLAAAAMGSQSYRDSGKRLILCYHDTGAAILSAGWTAEE